MRTMVAVALLAGCFSPTYPEGAPCGPGAPCPAHFVCSASQTCVERDPDAPCDAGYVEEQAVCVDVDECATAAAGCSPDATCTNAPGTFSCTCNPGFAGDGATCTRVCTKVLIYDDCTGPDDADCDSIAEPLFADNAALGLGLEVLYGGVANEPAFQSLFDAGGFDLVIVESSLSPLATDTADRIASWIDGGGRAIVSFWDLDNATTGMAIRTAADVATLGELTTPLDVHPDPASPVDFLSYIETVPAPLTFTELMVDDGDELAPGATGGFVAARHTSDSGPGAIVVTRSDRVITLGFVPVGLVFEGPRDADVDGTPDVQELYTNLIGYLCAY